MGLGRDRTGAVSAQGFEMLAEVYARARPGYPEALLDYLMPKVGVVSGDPIAEIGAGTGRLTEILARRGLSVTALEPLDAMRNQAPHIKGVRWTDGTFENTGLENQSQKWVVSSQAFHWAEAEIALPEIRRVLQSEGWLTAIWNAHHVGKEPFLRDTFSILKKHAPAYHFVKRTRAWRRLSSKVFGRLPDPIQGVLTRTAALVGDPGRISRGLLLRSSGDFHRVQYHEVHHHHQVNRETFLDLWRSRLRIRSSAGPQAFETFIQELTQELDRRGIHTVKIPYVCGAWSAQAR